MKSPYLSNGGLHFPFAADGVCRFEPHQTFSAGMTVTLGDRKDGCLSGPKKIIVKLQVNLGPTLAGRLKRVSVDSDGNNKHFSRYVNGVLERRGECKAFEKAPRAAIGGGIRSFDVQ